MPSNIKGRRGLWSTCDVLSPAVGALGRVGIPSHPLEPLTGIISVNANVVEEVVRLHVVGVIPCRSAGICGVNEEQMQRRLYAQPLGWRPGMLQNEE